MSWARNGLALAPLPHEDTPLQHLQSADDGFAGHDQQVVSWRLSDELNANRG